MSISLLLPVNLPTNFNFLFEKVISCQSSGVRLHSFFVEQRFVALSVLSAL